MTQEKRNNGVMNMKIQNSTSYQNSPNFKQIDISYRAAKKIITTMPEMKETLKTFIKSQQGNITDINIDYFKVSTGFGEKMKEVLGIAVVTPEGRTMMRMPIGKNSEIFKERLSAVGKVADETSNKPEMLETFYNRLYPVLDKKWDEVSKRMKPLRAFYDTLIQPVNSPLEKALKEEQILADRTDRIAGKLMRIENETPHSKWAANMQDRITNATDTIVDSVTNLKGW